MAVDIFLSLDGITGESRDERHRGSIDLSSFSFGLANPGSAHAGGSGAAAGKVSFQEIHCTSDVSLASPQLALHCANGSHIKTGTITVRRAGDSAGSGQEFYVVKLKEIVITSVQDTTNSDEGPKESITFVFGALQVEYHQQNPDGSSGASSTFSWDLKNARIV